MIRSLMSEDGRPLVNHSAIKAFRMCPREAYYKYVLELRPKVYSTPLTRGKWVHAVFETYYKVRAEDPGTHESGVEAAMDEHKRWTLAFSKLFDEEKEKLGDLPREIERLLKSYWWHYQYDCTWEVLDVEQTLEADLPNGYVFKGRADMLIADGNADLWLVDHKTHKKMPDWNFRLLDEQSALYIWAARQMGIPVRGFIWNYIVTSAPSVPSVVKDGSRFYSRCGDTTYPIYARAVKQAKAEFGEVFLADPNDKAKVRNRLAQLKADRFSPLQPGVQISPFFRRDIMEKDEGLIERVVKTTMRTGEAMHTYDFTSDVDAVERSVQACKGFMCSYRSLTTADLLHGDSTMDQMRDYDRVNPMDYYEETEERL